MLALAVQCLAAAVIAEEEGPALLRVPLMKRPLKLADRANMERSVRLGFDAESGAPSSIIMSPPSRGSWSRCSRVV